MKTCISNLPYLSDEDIIELYFGRDERAITETDKKYGGDLFAYAYRIVNDVYVSDECKNDTYLGVWEAIPPERPKKFKAFIFSIMRNIAINRFKEKNRKKRIQSDMTLCIDELHSELSSPASQDAECDSAEISRCLNLYLEKLSEKNRYIFISRFYMYKSEEAIALSLSMSKSGVCKALKRMVKNLKKHLLDCGIEL